MTSSAAAAVLIGFAGQFGLALWICRKFSAIVEQWKREAALGRNALLNSSEVRQLLQRMLHRSLAYEILRRLTVAMPLAGVLLTWLKFGELSGDAGMQRLLASGRSLYDGVAAGAFLALLNQGMLVLVHYRWERYTANVDLPEDTAGITAAAADFSTGLRVTLSRTVGECNALISEVQSGIRERSAAVDNVLADAISSHRELAERLTAEFSSQLHEAINVATASATATLQATQKKVNDNNELMLKSIQSVLDLHNEVSVTLQQVKSGSESLTTISATLTTSTTAISDSFEELNTVGLPQIKATLDVFRRTLEALQKMATDIIREIRDNSNEMKGMVTSLVGAGSTLNAAAEEFQQSTGALSQHYLKAGEDLAEVVGQFGQQMQERVLNKLVNLQSRSATITEEMLQAAEQFPGTIEDFASSLTRAGGHLQSLDDVSRVVQQSVHEMHGVTENLRESVLSQQAELRDWRVILEQIPKSLRMDADGQIEALIRDLGRLTGVLGEIFRRSEQAQQVTERRAKMQE